MSEYEGDGTVSLRVNLVVILILVGALASQDIADATATAIPLQIRALRE